MNKINYIDVKQIKLHFNTVESWLKIRTSTKDSKCENCGKLHKDCIGDITFAVVSGRVNAHLCEDCGKYFISKGAEDVEISQNKYQARKQKLITQAKRIGISFDGYWGYKTSEVDVEKLTQIIKAHISAERKQFHEFLNLNPKIKTVLNSFVTCLNLDLAKQGYKDTITSYDVYKSPNDFFSEYDFEISRDSHRWLDYLTVKSEVYNKTFSWGWATCTGDNSIHDQGFEFDFDTLIEIPAEDLITDTDRINWLDTKGIMQHLLPFYDKDIRKFIDSNILEEQKLYDTSK